MNYKRLATSASSRERFTVGLAAVLWSWLVRHEQCLARTVGADAFPVVTTVPSSTSGRTGVHPLVRLVSGVVVGSNARYRELLQPGAAGLGRREFSPHRFTATSALSGEAVLVIDDTWTTGAHAHGAAAALKGAGAGRVAVLAIGRWYHPGGAANAPIERQRRERRWSWETCMFEDDRLRA